MAVKLTQAIVRELLDYNSETGELRWRLRDQKWFVSGAKRMASWNVKFAGKPAFTLVDDDGYFRGSIFNKSYLAHRIIWLWVRGQWPESQIDHINHARSDNRWTNLRQATNRQNAMNASSRKNSTGHTGVYWSAQNQRWIVYIGVRNQQIYVGSYSSLEAAIDFRKRAERRYGFHPNHGKVPSHGC